VPVKKAVSGEAAAFSAVQKDLIISIAAPAEKIWNKLFLFVPY